MLGCLQQTHPDVDGVPADVSARANKDDKSVPFLPRATEEKQMELDPRHETEHVLRQLPGVAAVDVSRRPNRRVPKLRADIFQRLAITQKQTGKSSPVGTSWPTLRNVQMTLHGMVKHGEQHIYFVFPAQAIWVQDQWWPGEKRPYPAPMLLLTKVFARRTNDAHAYDEVIVPFLDRVINQFPVWGYPRNPPAPPLSDLLKDWNIVVRFGDRFERVYRRGDPAKTLLLEFQGV